MVLRARVTSAAFPDHMLAGVEGMRSEIWLQFLPASLCLIAAGSIYHKSLGTADRWRLRSHFAALIPGLYTWLLLLLWVVPIQVYLTSTLTADSKIPVLSFTVLGMMFGASLPHGYFRLRPNEYGGELYQRVGVRRFRSLVTFGDQMVRLMRSVDPQSQAPLNRGKLDDREKSARRSERIHWAMLLGSLPAGLWAMSENDLVFAAHLAVANIPMNLYPIMLQRYTRARLERLRERATNMSHSRLQSERLEKCLAS